MNKKTFAVDIDGTITENGGGRIHLDALSALRQLTKMGHNVIFVTGRSSVEGFLLSVFGGTTKIAVGEMADASPLTITSTYCWETSTNAKQHSKSFLMKWKM